MEKIWSRIEKIGLYKAMSENKILGKVVNREFISYVFFGVLTTVVSIVSFYLANKLLTAVGWQGVLHLVKKDDNYAYIDANVLSWIGAVIFAYITNKLYVFNSKSTEKSVVTKEFLSFIGSRLFSGIVDTLAMYLFVSVLGISEMISKLVVQVIVVVLNYILSKLIVFRKKQAET